MVDENQSPVRFYDPALGPEQTRMEYADSPTGEPRIKGFPFPLSRNSPRGFFYRAVDYELVRGDLVQLIMTEPGERVMMPQYGVGLRRMFFEQGDTILYEEARRRMLNAINQWEPRIVVRALTVSAPKEDDPRLINFDGRDNSLIISIEYSLKDDLDNIDSLVFRTNFNTSKLL